VGSFGGRRGLSSSSRRAPGSVVIIVAVASLVLAASVAYLAVRVRQHQEAAALPRPSGIPASVPTSLVNLMGLSPVPLRPAPDFTLTDQAGHAMSLASLRGRVVVLEFMDPHCIDICPIVSQEFIEAYRDLGGRASHVVFAAVNVNRYHLGVADVAAFSREQRLTTVPSWHFFTGSYQGLRAVWQAYEVAVDAPSRNADVIHSSLVYFIDPRAGSGSWPARWLITPPADPPTCPPASSRPGPAASRWWRGLRVAAVHREPGRDRPGGRAGRGRARPRPLAEPRCHGRALTSPARAGARVLAVRGPRTQAGRSTTRSSRP
jgi:protein SCO1/2